MSILLASEHHWVCPNCTFTDITHEAGVHTRFHSCAGLKGLTSPMVEEGISCKIESIEREDYIGLDEVQYDGDGWAISAVVTTRDEGNDCAVLAPCATGRIEE